MKVLFFANTAWYLHNFRLPLAKFLRERGCEVVMVSPAGPYGERLQAAGFRWIPLAMDRRSLHPVRELRVLRDLGRIYAAEKPDIVHHFTIKCVVYGSFAAWRQHIRKRVNAIAGLGYVFTSNEPRARFLRPVVRGLLRCVGGGRYTRLIVQNAEDFAYCRRAHLAPPENMRLIRGSGVDTNRFRPRAERHPVSPVTRVLLAARLVAEKGVREYVEAARQLRETHIPVEFLLAGEPDSGNPGAIAPSLVREWHSKGWVTCLGHVSDMAALLDEIDIAVLPSYGGEGVPRGLLEAAAAGLPIIATDVPGCRDIVEHGVNGFRVPAREAAPLAESVRILHDDPKLRARMGKAGRAKVLTEFDEVIVHERTFEVYRELMGDRPRVERQHVIPA